MEPTPGRYARLGGGLRIRSSGLDRDFRGAPPGRAARLEGSIRALCSWWWGSRSRSYLRARSPGSRTGPASTSEHSAVMGT